MTRLDGYIGDHPNTAAEIARSLEAADGESVEIIVNSAGGDAFEGAAIYAELSAYPGQVTAHIRGIAASAASLLVMGANVITMAEAAVFMIHDPSGATFGRAREHRNTADTLDKLAATYAAVYAARSGNTEALVRQWMDAETWLDAEEAVALGFADYVEAAAEPEMVARCDYTKFAHAPRALIALARANGWATVSPEQGPSRDALGPEMETVNP